METNDQDPKLQARITELMKMTKPQLKALAKNTYRPGYRKDAVGATVWSVISGGNKWEIAYHIARVEVQGY